MHDAPNPNLVADDIGFDRLLDEFPAFIAYVDQDFSYRFANAYYAKMLRLPQGDILGHHVREILGPAAFAVVEPNLQRALAGDPLSYQAFFPFPHFECWLHVHYVPDASPAGVIRGVFVMGVDITEQKRLESHLARSREEYRALVENAGIGIGYYDTAGRLLLLNRKGAEEFGGIPEDFHGRTLSEILGPEAGGKFERRIREVAASGRNREFTDEVALPSGTKSFLSTYTCMKDGVGAAAGVQIISHDITELKCAEENNRRLAFQLQQAIKMEAIGKLAGGIAHDFNNILQTVLGFAQVFKDPDAGASDWEESLRIIEEACKRGANLTQQLLAFSRQQVLKKEVIDLNQSVRDSLKMVRRLLGEDIVLKTDFLAEEARILADAGQLSQIIMNLAVNARDAMPDGGRLTVRTFNQEITAADAAGRPGLQPGYYTVLAVGDTGQGMSPEISARIFEPFFTTKEFGKGSGLGLATVYSIVKQHDGYIDVASRCGEGALFTIYLMNHKTGAPATVAGARTLVENGGSETILLAEDDPEILKMIQLSLVKAGYTVLTAPSGTAALEVFTSFHGQIDLVILDVVMPGPDGRKAYRMMKEISPDLRALFISGYPMAEEGALAAWDPALPLLNKPFQICELQQAIRTVIESAA